MSGETDDVTERIRHKADLEAAARAALTKNDVAGAARSLEQVLELQADDLFALDTLGFCYFFLKRPADAERCCRRALEVDPGRVYALKGLGLCLAAQGRIEEGVASLREAIVAAPGYYDARHDLGVVLLEANREREALEAFEEAARLDPLQGRALSGTIEKLRRQLGPAPE